MPGKKHTVPKNILVIKIDNFDECVVHYTIHNCYAQGRTVMTIAKLLVYSKRAVFKRSCSSLKRIVRDHSFMWKKTRANRGVLTKSLNIWPMRISYITALRQHKAEGCPSYSKMRHIHGRHTRPKNCTDNNNSDIVAPTTKHLSLFMLEEPWTLLQIQAGNCRLSQWNGQ